MGKMYNAQYPIPSRIADCFVELKWRHFWGAGGRDVAGKLPICVNDYGATDNWRLMTGSWEQIHTGAWSAKQWYICPQPPVISRQ
jgi:hypothetical protein